MMEIRNKDVAIGMIDDHAGWSTKGSLRGVTLEYDPEQQRVAKVLTALFFAPTISGLLYLVWSVIV